MSDATPRSGPARAADHVFLRDPRAHYFQVSHGRGVYLFDTDGRAFLDGGGGAGVACLGHAHPRLVAALSRQAGQVAFAHTTMFLSEPLVELSDRLAAQLEPGARVYLVSGGSEAIETAIKIARSYQLARGRAGRDRLVTRSISYHGASLGALSATGLARRRAPYTSMLLPFTHASTSYCYRCPFGLEQPSCALACATDIEHAVAGDADTIAAVMIEPVVGASAPGVDAPPGYLSRVAAACAREDILLIADEVLCGTGRTGRFLAVHHDDVVPDVVVLSKALGAGHIPLGAVIVRRHVYEAISNAAPGHLVHGFTYAGMPLAAAVGLEVMRVMEDEGIIAGNAGRGARLLAGLDALRRHSIVGDVRGRGLLIGVEFVADRGTRACFPAQAGITQRIYESCLDEGLIVYPCGGTVDGRLGDQILVAPPFIIHDDEIDELVSRLDRAVARVTASVADGVVPSAVS